MEPDTTTPGGKPVMAVPGLTPTFPVTTLDPVLVTVEPASTAKLCAEPREGAVCANTGDAEPTSAAIATPAAKYNRVRFIG